MPKFLIKATYTAEGARGLVKDGGSARRAAVQKLIEAQGGKLEAFYFAYGDDDAIIICDMPDANAGLATSLTGIQAYASAKAGLIGLTRQLGHELGPFGITVNSIAPGFVRSNPTTERQWEAMGQDGQARLVESIAMRRLGTPDDIVHGVLFFASDFASWITGQVLSIDGGR